MTKDRRRKLFFLKRDRRRWILALLKGKPKKKKYNKRNREENKEISLSERMYQE